jgi:hypothetical protein
MGVYELASGQKIGGPKIKPLKIVTSKDGFQPNLPIFAAQKLN